MRPSSPSLVKTSRGNSCFSSHSREWGAQLGLGEVADGLLEELLLLAQAEVQRASSWRSLYDDAAWRTPTSRPRRRLTPAVSRARSGDGSSPCRRKPPSTCCGRSRARASSTSAAGTASSRRPLAEAGHDVTVVGSREACRARVQRLVDGGRVRFQAADLLRLPFGARAFDVALAFRLLPHVARWRELVAELCRVASRAVIVDYPTRRSINAVAAPLFGAEEARRGRHAAVRRLRGRRGRGGVRRPGVPGRRSAPAVRGPHGPAPRAARGGAVARAGARGARRRRHLPAGLAGDRAGGPPWLIRSPGPSRCSGARC